ncbi:MAG: hypothetical protein LBU60_01580 [Clostridiales bacterium]|jgi:hypothetical protein|nr:hypothetical protein [Clostridiales bacterium]
MIRKISIIIASILLLTAMSSLTACVKKDKSIHDIWDMKLASDGQTIEVFGLTSKGEKQATDGNGVFDFPTEVNGKTKFYFKAIKGYMGRMDWGRFNSLDGIIFDKGFKVENLYLDRSNFGLLPVWLIFEGEQEQFLNNDVCAGRGIVFRQNERIDFDMPDWMFDSSENLRTTLIFKDDIDDNQVVIIDGVYYGQIFDESTDNNEIIVPNGVVSVASAGGANPLIYGRSRPSIGTIRIESQITRIQGGNILGNDATLTGNAARQDLKKVYLYGSTEIEKWAFAPNVMLIDIITGEVIVNK